MSEKLNLGGLHLSAVNEMANIGLGRATTALSDMTGRFFGMQIPSVSAVGIEHLVEAVSPAESICVAAYMSMAGDVDGHIVFVFPWSSAQELWRMLLGTTPDEPAQVDELFGSAMLEIGNILNSSFLSALSDFTNLNLEATPPLVSVDQASAILESIAATAEYSESVALVIETTLHDDSGRTQGFFVCLPTVEALNRLFGSLGLAEAA